MQALWCPLTAALPDNRNHSHRNTDIRLLALVPKKSKTPHILSVNLASPIVALNLNKMHPIVPNAFKNGEQLLHTHPHLFASMVDGVVLVVERNVFGVESEARADVVAFRVNGRDVPLQKSLRRCCWAVGLPLGSGDVADKFGHGAVLEVAAPGC